MIRQTLTGDDALERDIAFLEDQSQVVYEVVEESVNEIRPFAIDELQYQPSKPKYPLRWASEKQRRFVMAKLTKENNLPYRRTGKLAEQWRMYLLAQAEGSFSVVIENASPVSKFVYGSLAQDRGAALRFQQPFHQDTGWFPATDTVKYWFDALDDMINQKLDERFEAHLKEKPKRRAYTKGTRRT